MYLVRCLKPQHGMVGRACNEGLILGVQASFVALIALQPTIFWNNEDTT
jgi:hypothetical protein